MRTEVSKEQLEMLAEQLMFGLDGLEIETLQKEFKELEELIALLDHIDTENVQEMVYPFEENTTYIREDEVKHTISQQEALLNAKEVNSGHVSMPKVVK